MSDDEQLFRSRQPHEVSLPDGGGNAVGKSGHAGQGDTRELHSTTVFAPLDDPPSLAEAEIAAAGAREGVAESDPASGDAVAQGEANSERSADPADQSSRRSAPYRLSDLLMARATAIRAQTAELATQIEQLNADA